MSAFLNIVKELTGEVTIEDANSGFVYKQLAEDAALFTSNRFKNGGVWVVDKNGEEFSIETDNVLTYELKPNPPFSFSGDTRNLYELLETSLFYNLVNPPSGGGGVVESNITLQGSSTTLNNSQYIIVATANITLTLPSGALVGQVYKIFANNNIVQINRGGSQLIIGRTSVSIRNYSAVILQYVNLNNWLII